MGNTIEKKNISFAFEKCSPESVATSSELQSSTKNKNMVYKEAVSLRSTLSISLKKINLSETRATERRYQG